MHLQMQNQDRMLRLDQSNDHQFKKVLQNILKSLVLMVVQQDPKKIL